MGGPALGRVTRITWPGQARSRRWSQFTARCYGADAMGQQSAEDGPSLGHEALAYADTLYNLARYLTGNVADAEDLVQETYARAIRATDQFTSGSNLKAWLFRILRNTFISAYRRQRHNPTVGGFDTVDPNAQGPADEEWLRGDHELHRLRNVVGEEIERALMMLSDESTTSKPGDLRTAGRPAWSPKPSPTTCGSSRANIRSM
jgi:RNA polymerase sigma factor (sigma-70 family)